MPLKDRRPSPDYGKKISLLSVLSGLFDQLGTDVSPNPNKPVMSEAEAAQRRAEGFTMPDDLHTYENTPAFVGNNIFAKPRAREMSNQITQQRLLGDVEGKQQVANAYALIKPHIQEAADRAGIDLNKQKDFENFMVSPELTSKKVTQQESEGRSKNTLESEREKESAANKLQAEEIAAATKADPSYVQDVNAPALALKQGESDISTKGALAQLRASAAYQRGLTNPDQLNDTSLTNLSLEGARAKAGMEPALVAKNAQNVVHVDKNTQSVFDPATGQELYSAGDPLRGIKPRFFKPGTVVHDKTGQVIDSETGQTVGGTNTAPSLQAKPIYQGNAASPAFAAPFNAKAAMGQTPLPNLITQGLSAKPLFKGYDSYTSPLSPVADPTQDDSAINTSQAFDSYGNLKPEFDIDPMTGKIIRKGIVKPFANPFE